MRHQSSHHLPPRLQVAGLDDKADYESDNEGEAAAAAPAAALVPDDAQSQYSAGSLGGASVGRWVAAGRARMIAALRVLQGGGGGDGAPAVGSRGWPAGDPPPRAHWLWGQPPGRPGDS
jgi:hypothetical protein